MAPTIRLATEDDATPIHTLYAPYVLQTAISFELEPPTVEEMRQRIQTRFASNRFKLCSTLGFSVRYGGTRARAE